MRFLFDAHHPAHVHFFRHLLGELRKEGHETLVVVRDKDCTVALLDEFGIPFHRLAPCRGGVAGLALEMAERHLRLSAIVARFRPDLLVGIAGLTLTHVGRLRGTPSVVFTDTEHARLSHFLFLRWATAICTPSCYPRRYGARQVSYPSYHELAYLHPRRFDASRADEILAARGLASDRPFVVCRFVSWKAAHDIGKRGFSRDQIRPLLDGLSRFGDVYVSSEARLPPEFDRHRLPTRTTEIHHALARAALYVGEGATMASEAAVLGTPAIYVNPLRVCYVTEEEERYGLVRQFATPRVDSVIRAAEELLSPAGRERARDGHRRLLADKIDLTAWMKDRLLDAVTRVSRRDRARAGDAGGRTS